MTVLACITYDPGPNTVTAELSECTPGFDYILGTPLDADVQMAVGTTLTLSCNGVNPSEPNGFLFDANVIELDTGITLSVAPGSTTFSKGTSDYQAVTSGQWLYNGDKTITWTAFLINGVNYRLTTLDAINGNSSSSIVTGTGAIGTLSLTLASAPTDGLDEYTFIAQVFDDDSGESAGCRIFYPANTGAADDTNRGFPGNPQPAGSDAVFVYDGAGNGEVTFPSQAGATYSLTVFDDNFFGVSAVGTGNEMTINATGISQPSGLYFGMLLEQDQPNFGGGKWQGIALFAINSPSPQADPAIYNYDGCSTVEVTLPTVPGDRYFFTGVDFNGGYDGNTVIAAGTTTIHNVVAPWGAAIGDGFGIFIEHRVPGLFFPVISMRLFQTGVPGSGFTDLTYPGVSGPGATSTGASAITSIGATLNGIVNPGGVSSVAFFQYGLTAGLGQETPHVNIGAGTDAIAFSQDITIQPNHQYFFRVVMEQ